MSPKASPFAIFQYGAQFSKGAQTIFQNPLNNRSFLNNMSHLHAVSIKKKNNLFGEDFTINYSKSYVFIIFLVLPKEETQLESP